MTSFKLFILLVFLLQFSNAQTDNVYTGDTVKVNNQQKNKSKIDGNQKFVYYTYSPLIAIKDKTNENLDLECWQLEYSGKWRRFPYTAMISATISY